MPRSSALRPQMKGHSGASLQAHLASTQASYRGGTMRRLFRASPLERIVAFFRSPQGLAVLCTLWTAFVLALVFVSTRLI